MRRLAYAAGALAVGCAGITNHAIAQNSGAGDSVSYPVVQPLPSRESLELNAALSKLGRNPRDFEALVDAGNAALAMGDVDAAFGFFRRADQISSGNSRVKAGLASAMVRKGDPVAAIALFDEAEKAGAGQRALAGDRGLAHDLVGDSKAAQRYYNMALADGPDDEVTRRLALSLAISGDRPGMEMTLLPLLRNQDKAAWRTRAFALAIMGRTDEAVRIAKTILPEKLASDVSPYLRYMPRLTPAQQAAAANLGSFPRASEIGRDDPRIAQLGSLGGRSASADAGLVPRGEPLGGERKPSKTARQTASTSNRKDESRSKAAARKLAASSKERAVRTAPPEPQPARQVGSASEPVLAMAPAKASAPVASPTEPEPAAANPQPSPARVTEPAKPVPASREPAPPKQVPPVVSAPQDSVTPAPTVVSPVRTAEPIAKPGFDLASLPNSQVSGSSAAAPSRPEQEAVVAGPPATGAEERLSLAEAFSDFGKPATSAVPVSGAVDIRKIKPASPEPEPAKAAPPKPAPPSHPSRIWVQLGIGRDKAALAFDWRRLVRKAPKAFRGQKAFVSELGQTNRMLTGPFESTAAANRFIGELHEADIDGPYVWTSPAGQVVDSLTGR